MLPDVLNSIFHRKPRHTDLLLFFLGLILFLLPTESIAQCTNCGAVTQTVNLSSKADTAWVQNGPSRSGTCCAGSNCVTFIVYVNPGSDLLSFDVTNPAPSGAAYYQINCGNTVSIGQPACISGAQGTICITYCKPGGDTPNYSIIASKTVKASSDATVRVGCSKTMTVGGLAAGSVTWTSISPGTSGLYNSYLNCSVGCTSPIITPSAATPTQVAYKVTGNPISGCPGTNGDTVLVTIVPGLTATIFPSNPVVCSGGTATTAITASVSGGLAPYTFTWSNSAQTQSAGVSSGNYTLLTGDNTSGCALVSSTINVASITTPPTPSVSANTPLCAGETLSLSISSSGSSYAWDGPGSFVSTLQNPTFTTTTGSAGMYSATVTYSGCTSAPGTISIVVNASPLTPAITGNAPVCSGQNLLLSTAFVSGASYFWSGPNLFSSTLQSPTVTATSTLSGGAYSLTISNAGCSSPVAIANVTVNQTPSSPTASNNGPLCEGQNLTLMCSPGGLNYVWTGPNAFTSTLQSVIINSVGIASGGTYSVTANNGNCTSAPALVSVTIHPNPFTPTISSTNTVCTGQTLGLNALPNGLSYSWTGPNSFTSSLQNPTVTVTSTLVSGVYSLITSSSGCSSPTATMQITAYNTPAAPVAGNNSPICENSGLQLNAGPGNYIYNWTGPNGFASTQQNPVVVNAVQAYSGVYLVTASDNGCTSPAATTNVTIYPIPTAPVISGTSTLCTGQTLTLTASPSGAITYNWSGPNSFSSSQQSISISNVTSVTSGSYSVTRVVNGCTSPAGTLFVTVNSTPSVPVAGYSGTTCTGQAFSLTASPNGYSYLWSGPGSYTSVTQNPSVIATSTAAAGVYSLWVTSFGCTSQPGTINVFVNATPASPTISGTSTLCAGSTLSVNATGVSGSYNWSGPNNFSSGLQNTTIASAQSSAGGTYSVNVAMAGCTSAPATFSVSVFDIPSTPTVTANTPLCTGQTLSLTAGFMNGALYQWTGPNGFNSSLRTPAIGSVIAANGGNYSVNVSVSGCSSNGTVIAVSVNATPQAPVLTNNTPVCTGGTLNFSASPGGGNYTWYGPDNFTSTTQNPLINNVTTSASGVYSAAISINGCTSTFATTSATVNPVPSAPSVNGPANICTGQLMTLSATGNNTSYNWAGPNSFTSVAQNPPAFQASPASGGTYSVIATNLGCASPAGTIIVVVNSIPPQPTIAANSPICALQTLSLSAGPGSSNYSWSGPGGFTSNSQNPIITSAPVNSGGSYSVTQTVSGCISAPAILQVTVNPAAPTPTVSSNSPVCINGNIQFTQSAISSATYSWSGPNGFFASSQNVTVSNVQNAAGGTYSVFATVSGCAGNTLTIPVLVSNPATLSVGPTTTVCANNSTVALNGTSSTGSGTWTSGGSGNFSGNNLSGIYLPSSADISAGLVTLTLTSTNNGGCPPSSLQHTVVITPAPTAYAGTSQTVCANNATVNLNGSVTVASGGIWSSSGSGSFVPGNTALTASYVPGATDITAGSVTITLSTTGNGNCLQVSHSQVVTISPAPIVSFGANQQFVCKNNPGYQLNGSSTTGSLSWLSSGTGSFSPNSNIVNPFYFPSTADTTSGSITLTVSSANNGGCSSVSHTLMLIYTNTLSISAGSSQTICSNTAAQLIGISTTSAGIWSSGGNGLFSPSPSSLNTTYIPGSSDINAGAVTLTLVSTNNGGCNPVSSTITLSIVPGPSVNAGSNQTICANTGSVSLSGSFSMCTGASWSSAGTGSFSPVVNSASSVYFVSPQDTTAGSVILGLITTGNGICSPSSDTLMVTFYSAPVVNSGSILHVCKNNPATNLNGYCSTGTGTWTSFGSGMFNNSTLINPVYTPGSSDTSAAFIQLILTSGNNAGCNPVSDTLNVYYSSPPIVSAGSDKTVCANNALIALTGTSSTGSGIWAGGTGTFMPDSLLGNYSPGVQDITAGQITLTLSSANNGGCLPSSDQMTVFITSAPEANAGTDLKVCSNTSGIQLGGSYSISTGASWSSSGTGFFIPSSSDMNAKYIPGNSDTLAGNIVIRLITTGNGNCLAVSDSLKVSFSHSPFVFAGHDIALCPGSPLPVLNGTTSTGTCEWTSLGNGSFVPNNTVSNPVYVPGKQDSLYALKLVLRITDSVCGTTGDTMVLSFHAKPVASFISSSRCLGTVTGFSTTSTTPEGSISSWKWRFNNDTSSGKYPMYPFGSAGNHTVQHYVSNGYCTDSVSSILFIQSLQSPSFTYIALCNDSVRFIQTTPLTVNGTMNWEFGDGQASALANPHHIYPDTGSYIVSLVLTNDSGCTARYEDTIQTKHCVTMTETRAFNPVVPSGFTPNGDGVNDVLLVKGGPFSKFSFRVFNEWGNQIFSSDIQTLGWDGRYRSSEQPAGRFIWTLDVESSASGRTQKAGEVYLNR